MTGLLQETLDIKVNKVLSKLKESLGPILAQTVAQLGDDFYKNRP
jgi:hypothetical protein